MNKARRSDRFLEPLILILVVAAVAGLFALAMLKVTGSTGHHGAGRVQAEIQAMNAGLESYKADHEDYPMGTNLTPSSTGNNAFLFLALNGTNGSGKVYVEFNKNQTNAAGCLVDPQGNLYGYQYPGDPKRSGTNFFDLWSFGKDRSARDTNLWIRNW